MTVESAWLQRSKLNYEVTVIKFCFQFQLEPLRHGDLRPDTRARGCHGRVVSCRL